MMLGFWGSHVFDAGRLAFRPLTDGVSLNSQLDVEQKETTEAQNPLDVKGGDKPQGFSVPIMTTPLAGGLAPEKEYNSWVRDLGQSNPFILGNMVFGPPRSILKNVSLSDIVFGPKGNMIAGKITLDFVEDEPLSATGKDVKDDRKGPSKAEKAAKKKSSGAAFSFTEVDRAEATRLQKEAGIK